MSTGPPLRTDVETEDDKSRESVLERGLVTLNDSALDIPEASSCKSRVWWKLDLLVLPTVGILSCLACLDLANVGNAKIAGLQQTLGISDEQFSLALMAGFIPPVIIQMPSNYLMVVVGPHILCPIALILLGLIGAMQGVVTSYPAFVVCRVVMGLFSGALFPGIALYLTYFYPRRMIQTRMSVMYSALHLAAAISSLLAVGIVHMDGVGKKPGYAWLFLLEGVACIALGFIILLVMPKRPTSALLLSGREKQYVNRVLTEDGISAETVDVDKFLHEMRRSLAQPHVLLISLAGFLADIIGTGLPVFLPSIVVGLGFEGSKAQLMSFPPFASGAICSFLTSLVSDRYGCRGVTIIICATVAVLGFAVFIASDRVLTRYISLSLAVSGASSTYPALSAWLSNNTAPFMRRTSAIAFAATVTQFGAILSSWLYGPISAPPAYTSATIALLACQVSILLCAMSTFAYFVIQNRRKKVAREEYMLQHGERPPQETSVSNESIWFEYVM